VFALYVVGGSKVERHGLEQAVVSIGLVDPHPPRGRLRVFDFGSGGLIEIGHESVVAVANAEPARATFAPQIYGTAEERLAANRKVVRLPLRRTKERPTTEFTTGYDAYAREAALFWRGHGVGSQPLLAAGVFALSSIQTPIASALKLFSMLTPHVIRNELPNRKRLERIVVMAGAGLHDPQAGRPAWYHAFGDFRHAVVTAIADGQRDDALRRNLAVELGMPIGLGLAKLSFTLALVGNDLGCLDARIIGWAFTEKTGARFVSRIAKKRDDGTVTEGVYADYRKAELDILTETPFYDPSDPVGLARSQWMLWEALGPDAVTHTHEELFEAVLEPRLLEAL
jgi:hypothetical protein